MRRQKIGVNRQGAKAPGFIFHLALWRFGGSNKISYDKQLLWFGADRRGFGKFV